VRRHEAKGKVLDRLHGRYSKSVVAVLKHIIELIKVEDWQTSGIEGLFSRPKTHAEMAFSTDLERHTVRRALRVLLQENFIMPSTETKNSYSVNTERLLAVPSNYVTRRTEALEQKIVNTVRMRFKREPEKQPKFASTHSAPDETGHLRCECVPHFCSHPSTFQLSEAA
jgi:predicted transcriptional regulator